MSLQVYNSLTRRKAAFEPITAGSVGMYICGPTVYDDCHIGHLMGPILFDTIARWLRVRGLSVTFVNNITDIDDKIITRARETGEDWSAIAERYTRQYVGFLRRLGIDTITDHPRCTDFIEAMIAYVADLVERDRAYVAGDGVYFDVQAHPGYGKLTGRKVDEMIAGARIERSQDLRSPADFCLWKFAKPGEPSWDSPWGAGRPGWHIECSVMSSSLLGDTFDIHGGGDDLKFPHHENEIAQGEAHGGDYARVWMHNGLMQFDGAKISKSDPRMADPAFAGQFKAASLLDTYGPATLRFFLLRGHYNTPFDFAPERIVEAQKALDRLHRFIGEDLLAEPMSDLADLVAFAGRVADLPLTATPILAAPREQFFAAMDDDFHTGKAIGQLFIMADPSALAQADAEGQRSTRTLVRDCGRLLGLFRPGDVVRPEAAVEDPSLAVGLADLLRELDAPPADTAVAGLMERILALRQQARADRDFATADHIREALTALGILVKDAKDGATWERKV